MDSEDSDETLMERIAEGDRGAFHALTRRLRHHQITEEASA